MSRQRHPLYRSRIHPKTHPGTVGGEYNFTYAGKDYSLPGRFLQDPSSPDGLRWIATRESNRIIRHLVCGMANAQCELEKSEQCWKWAPVDRGHPHHLKHKKMGGAFTDDRIWILIDGELTKLRVWSCPVCHFDHHNHLHWSRRAA